MNYKLKSLKTVIIKIIRDFNIGRDALPVDDMYEWCAEALQDIGAYSTLEEKEVTITICDYRGELPCDYAVNMANPGLKYKVINNTIITDIKDGTVSFKYLAQPIDDEGYPMIPDSSTFDSALTWKVAMQLAIRGELPNKELSINFCMSRWHRYCRAARAEANFPDPEQVERIKNMWLNLKPHTEQYEALFKDVDGTTR